ncbi:MAG: hypothetical protein FJ148_27835 [Deltaproteobacteria bacterium]|nr:hypothetical protein [Deltaproteobacteria bacterium]
MPTTVDKARVGVSKLLPPANDDRLTASGTILALPTSPTIDPLAHGIRFLLVDSAGGTPVDVTIPGGGYDKLTKLGWTANAALTTWRYRNASASPVNGIKRVVLRAVPAVPGKYRWTVNGKNGTYAVDTANLPLTAVLVIDPPFAETGQCGETAFGPAGCSIKAAGSTVMCK